MATKTQSVNGISNPSTSTDVKELQRQFKEEAVYAFAPEGAVPDKEMARHLAIATDIAERLEDLGAQIPTPDDVAPMAKEKWGDACRGPYSRLVSSCFGDDLYSLE